MLLVSFGMSLAKRRGLWRAGHAPLRESVEAGDVGGLALERGQPPFVTPGERLERHLDFVLRVLSRPCTDEAAIDADRRPQDSAVRQDHFLACFLDGVRAALIAHEVGVEVR